MSRKRLSHKSQDNSELSGGIRHQSDKAYLQLISKLQIRLALPCHLAFQKNSVRRQLFEYLQPMQAQPCRVKVGRRSDFPTAVLAVSFQRNVTTQLRTSRAEMYDRMRLRTGTAITTAVCGSMTTTLRFLPSLPLPEAAEGRVKALLALLLSVQRTLSPADIFHISAWCLSKSRNSIGATKMFEVMGRTNTARIGKLPGSKHPGGEMLTETQASAIVAQVKCLDPACKAPVQLVRGTSVRRAHFRHRPDTTNKCCVGSPMSEWHSYVQGDLFEGAFAHEHSIPGARIDAVVQRVNSDKLVAIEVQYSPIDPAIVLQRHERHRAAGIAGTVWIVPASHRDSDGRVKTRWAMDLIQAALETPAAAPGEPGYGCVVGFLDLEGQEDFDQEPAVHFIDVIAKEQRASKPVIQVIKWVSPISLPAVRLWAQGKNRPRQILDEDLAAEVRRMDAVPTRRIKYSAPDKRWRKQGWL